MKKITERVQRGPLAPMDMDSGPYGGSTPRQNGIGDVSTPPSDVTTRVTKQGWSKNDNPPDSVNAHRKAVRVATQGGQATSIGGLDKYGPFGVRGLVPDHDPAQARTEPLAARSSQPTVSDSVLAWALGTGVGGHGQSGSFWLSAEQAERSVTTILEPRDVPKQDWPSGTPPAGYRVPPTGRIKASIVYPSNLPQGHDPADGPASYIPRDAMSKYHGAGDLRQLLPGPSDPPTDEQQGGVVGGPEHRGALGRLAHG
jgi:hypothetical protein